MECFPYKPFLQCRAILATALIYTTAHTSFKTDGDLYHFPGYKRRLRLLHGLLQYCLPLASSFSVVHSPVSSLPTFCGQLVSLIHCKLIQLTCIGVSFHWLWEVILACVLHQSGQSTPSAGCCVV